MKNYKRIGWTSGLVLAFSICAGIFYLGNLMTVHPASISGNGNPALLILPVLFIIGVLIARGWMEVITNWKSNLLWGGFVVIPILLYAAYRYQANEFDQYRTYVQDIVMEDEWRGGLDYVNRITSDVFSIYMNNQLYNVNTFFMYVGLTLWLGIVLILLKRSTFMQTKLNS